MSWWGKILGGIFGYLVNGPFTALLGFMLGHGLDSLGQSNHKKAIRREKIAAYTARANYFSATFYVMGHICKADGRVTAEEIRLASLIMDRMGLTGPQREKAISLFNKGKNPSFPIEPVLEKLRDACLTHKNLLRMFMEIQIMAAMADGELSALERQLLMKISERLGILPMEYRRIEDRVRITMNISDRTSKTEQSKTDESLANAYAFLGIDHDASDREVKRAYRRMLSQHHPDKLVSKGLPEEMIKLASKKTHEIRQAYELICASRGL